MAIETRYNAECKYCGTTFETKFLNTATRWLNQHEFYCGHNPDNKECTTCKHQNMHSRCENNNHRSCPPGYTCKSWEVDDEHRLLVKGDNNA